MKKDVNVESDGSELAIWGTQKKTEIGGMTVIGRKDQFGGPVAYVADRPDFIVKAVNCHDELVAALKLAQDALRGHDLEWPYMRAIRSALERVRND